MTFTSSEISKQQKTLKFLAAVFLLLALIIALGTIVGTLYLLLTPHGIGGWILPFFTFSAGLVLFLFLFSFSKILSILIEISSR